MKKMFVLFFLVSCGSPTIKVESQVKQQIGFVLQESTRKVVEDSLETLFVIQSKAKSGINSEDFSNEVSNAIVAADKMTRTKDAERHPSYANILEAVSHYQYAKQVWSCYQDKFQPGDISNLLEGSCYAIYGLKLQRFYEVKDFKPNIMFLPDVLQAIWSKASENIDKANQIKDSELVEPPVPTPTPVPYEKPYLTGVVKDKSTGNYLSGIQVKISFSTTNKTRETTTNNNGAYVFENVEIGSELELSTLNNSVKETCYAATKKSILQAQDVINADIDLTPVSCK